MIIGLCCEYVTTYTKPNSPLGYTSRNQILFRLQKCKMEIMPLKFMKFLWIYPATCDLNLALDYTGGSV